LIGLMPIRRFFPHSDLSQTTVVRAQHKLQGASLEMFSELISTFSAFVHSYFESAKVPFFCGSGRVRCAIRTFWHSFPLFEVIGEITIYHFHGTFASKSHLLLAMRARCHRILAISSILCFSQSNHFHNFMSLLRARKTINLGFASPQVKSTRTNDHLLVLH